MMVDTVSTVSGYLDSLATNSLSIVTKIVCHLCGFKKLSLLLFDIIIAPFPLPFLAFTTTYVPIFYQIHGFLFSLSCVIYTYIYTLYIHIYFQIQKDTLLCLNPFIYVLRTDHLILTNQLVIGYVLPWGRMYLLFTSLFCCLILFV